MSSGVTIVMRHYNIKDGALKMVDTFDPSGGNRLQKIEEALDQLSKQNISILEGLALLYRQGSERLDKIDTKLEYLADQIGLIDREESG